MQPNANRVAAKFMLRAIQDWGQSEVDRITAVQELLDFAGFKARAMSAPVFGGIWPRPCEGKEGPAATVWLKVITDTMRRGKLEDEIQHIERCIEMYRAGEGAPAARQ